MNASNTRERRQGIWGVALLLAGVGLALALELTRIHVRLEIEPSHQSFCNVNASFNCDAVAKSPYSMLLGLPLSVWGVLAYLAAIFAALWGRRTGERAAAGLLWLLGIVSVMAAVALAAISAFVVKSWCLYCLCTWVVDFGLFAGASSLVKPEGPGAALKAVVDWFRAHMTSGVVAVAIAVSALGATYLGYAQRVISHSRSGRGDVPSRLGPSAKPTEAVDEAGQPYVGAQRPKLVITEFSDYQCPHCARAHEQLRAIVAAYPNEVRVVHRHFPLDNDCNPKIRQVFHTHACYYARLAVCAASIGKFWQGNDYLFAHGRDESSVPIESFARAIETPADVIKHCLSNVADAMLKRDIEAGIERDVEGTPTFIINGEKYTGELPEEVLRAYPN